MKDSLRDLAFIVSLFHIGAWGFLLFLILQLTCASDSCGGVSPVLMVLPISLFLSPLAVLVGITWFFLASPRRAASYYFSAFIVSLSFLWGMFAFVRAIGIFF